MSPTSVILNRENQQFLSYFIDINSTTKTNVINNALDLFRKYNLQKELIEGFSKKTNKDVSNAMSDFEDYLSIVDPKV